VQRLCHDVGRIVRKNFGQRPSFFDVHQTKAPYLQQPTQVDLNANAAEIHKKAGINTLAITEAVQPHYQMSISSIPALNQTVPHNQPFQSLAVAYDDRVNQVG